MFSLPLSVPDVSEMLAVHYLDRGAPSALYHSVQWSGALRGPSAASGNGDVLAWGLVMFFLLTMGVIAGCIISQRSYRSRAAERAPVQQLIEEVQQNEDAIARGTPQTEGESWERDGDWWKDEADSPR